MALRLFSGARTHFSLDFCGANWRVDQIPYSDEVVSGGCKGEYSSDLVHTAMSGLAQHSHRLQPAEDFLYRLPFHLTHLVSGMPRRAPIDGATAPAFVVLHHVRGDLHVPHLAHELFTVAVFVGPDLAGCDA